MIAFLVHHVTVEDFAPARRGTSLITYWYHTPHTGYPLSQVTYQLPHIVSLIIYRLSDIIYRAPVITYSYRYIFFI